MERYGGESGDILTVTTEIPKIIRECYQQLYTNEFDTLEKKKSTRFLETHTLPRLNHEK